MSTTYDRPPLVDFQRELSILRKSWMWFVLLGVAMVVVGFVALSSVMVATLATAIVLGALLIAGGAVEIIGAFSSRGWSGVLLHLLYGVLSIVVGALFLRAPLNAVLAMTLLLACLLMAGGIMEIVASLMYRFVGWGWALVSGVVDLVLGVMIWLQWPEGALWVIGMFVGISLLFRGFNWIGLGLALRSAKT